MANITHSRDSIEDWADSIPRLQELTLKGYTNKEIVQLMKSDPKYNELNWSERTLKRRLKTVGVKRYDNSILVDDVRRKVEDLQDGPLRNKGIRAMHQAVREAGFAVGRDLVHALMEETDPLGLEARKLKNNRKKKIHDAIFRSPGPFHYLSLDGNDKLKGINNCEFPFGIYGGIDCYSRHVVFLIILQNNRDESAVGKEYFKMLLNYQICPRFLRVDLGNETTYIASIHQAIRERLPPDISWDNDAKFVSYGPSTSNITIERFWNVINETVVADVKPIIRGLSSCLSYESNESLDRELLSYLFLPVIQEKLNFIKEHYNDHRIRKQKGVELPTGCKPNFAFSCPEGFGGRNCGRQISHSILLEVGQVFGFTAVEQPLIISDDVKCLADSLGDPPTTLSEAASRFSDTKRAILQLPG